jgi:hypothetical protein
LVRGVDEADAELERRALEELKEAGFVVAVLTSRRRKGGEQ